MKRIGNSKEPTIKQLSDIAVNLREKFKKTFLVKVECWSHSHLPKSHPSPEFKVSVLPGFGIDCSQVEFNSWQKLLKAYRGWIKKESFDAF